jgi:hypothetical protein
MSRRDNITRWRAKGLWMDVLSVAGSRATLNRKVFERAIPSGITYSWELLLRWRMRRSHWGACGRHLNPRTLSKVAIDGPIEAVLGKTRRTVF